jgi:hypothetical protein
MKEESSSFLKKRTKKLLSDTRLIPAACAAFFPAPSCAQAIMQDRATLQVVGLFQHACLPYAGYAGNLRQWASRTGLGELPGDVASRFLSGAPGKAFNASTPDGKLILVSRDDGACMVVTPFASQLRAEEALLGVFRTENAVVTSVSDKVSRDGQVEQKLEKVALDKQAWHVSVTARLHPEDPAALSNLILMATATPL